MTHGRMWMLASLLLWPGMAVSEDLTAFEGSWSHGLSGENTVVIYRDDRQKLVLASPDRDPFSGMSGAYVGELIWDGKLLRPKDALAGSYVRLLSAKMLRLGVEGWTSLDFELVGREVTAKQKIQPVQAKASAPSGAGESPLVLDGSLTVLTAAMAEVVLTHKRKLKQPPSVAEWQKLLAGALGAQLAREAVANERPVKLVVGEPRKRVQVTIQVGEGP